jgi:hypothetical protein
MWWEQTGSYLSKMEIVPIVFFILLAINGGNVFAFVTGGAHQLVGVILNKGGIADWLCRMAKGFLALQTLQDTKIQSKTPKEIRNPILRVGRTCELTDKTSHTPLTLN